MTYNSRNENTEKLIESKNPRPSVLSRWIPSFLSFTNELYSNSSSVKEKDNIFSSLIKFHLDQSKHKKNFRQPQPLITTPNPNQRLFYQNAHHYSASSFYQRCPPASHPDRLERSDVRCPQYPPLQSERCPRGASSCGGGGRPRTP